jgi:hypothetical protein
MGVRVTNLTASRISLPDPLTYILKSREVRDFLYVEYDEVINIEEFVRLQAQRYIQIASLDPSSGGYDFAWNGPRRFFLDPYQIWIDGTGAMRIKPGPALFDLDGIVVGPGGIGLHGPTHVFNGTDPIPNIETLEDLWNCPVGVVVGDLVYATGADSCDRANASGIATMPVIGVVESKPTPITCIVAKAGDVGGFVGLAPDAPYFAGLLAGQMALTAPVGSGQVVQKIGYAKSATTLVIALGEHTIRA